MRWKKVLLVLGVVLLVGVGAALAGFLWLKGRGLPQRDGEASLPGLGDEVTVRFDERGVPMVTAGSMEDVWRAQGWLHANDRFFQMELGRRAAGGRLSEVVGEVAVPMDRAALVRRFPEIREMLWESASAEVRRALEAYAEGVNAWLAGHVGDLPPELVVTGVEPAPWTPRDSFSFVVVMADDLSFWNQRPEEARYLWLRRLGPEAVADLLGELEPEIPAAILEMAGHEAPEAPDGRHPGDVPVADDGPPALGSNNWVIGGSHTASGAPLVANDPHLGLRLPGVWYQVLLRAPGYEVAGMSLPGVPGVIIGRNADLAWAVTNTMLDDHDLFFEELDGTGTKVRRGEDWAEMETDTVSIPVQGGHPVEVVRQRTDRGPLLPADEETGMPPRSLAWTLYEPGDPFSAFLHLNRASSVEEALGGLDGFVAPAQNLVLADSGGHLAYTMLGRLPARRRGTGRVPAPGWDASYGWDGLEPFAANPRVTAPEDDLLVTANDDILPEGYDRPFSADFQSPSRAGRIRELLAARDGWTVEEVAAMQGDVVSPYARQVVALLAREPGLSEGAAEVVARLTGWAADPRLSGDDATVYSRVYIELLRGIFADEAREHRLPFAGSAPLLMAALRGDLEWDWFDDVGTPEHETRGRVIDEALVAAAGFRPGPYEDVHLLPLEHPMGRLPGVGVLFNRGPYPVPGDGSTINALSGNWLPGADHQSVRFGPSMRWIVDLSDPDGGLAVLPGGQSGHPFDPHYDDQIDTYLDNGHFPVPWTEAAVEGATVSRLRLTP